MATQAFLAVQNIEVIYDHVILVLRGVSLDVQEGTIVALLGANGAGKTTTLKAISNLLRAERGDVTKGQILYKAERIDRLNPAELVNAVAAEEDLALGHLATLGAEQVRDRLQRGGLAGAVRAEERDDLAFGHLERDPPQHEDHVVVDDLDVVDGQQVTH